MIAAPPEVPHQQRPPTRRPLRIGVVVVEVPRTVAEADLDDVVCAGTPWLLIDATAVEGPAWSVIEAVADAVAASERRPGSTCVVTRQRVPASTIATFTSIGDACQAKVLFDAGYGPGWNVRPSTDLVRAVQDLEVQP